MRSRRAWAWLTCAVLSATSTGLAAAQTPAPPTGGPPTPEAPKPDFPKFDEAMKDYTQVAPIYPNEGPGFFQLWYNKKTDSMRAQIPAGLLGQRFLIATSMAGGPVATGFQLDHFLAYLERMDKKLVLMRVDPRYAEGGNEVSDVIKRSYGGDDILTSIGIVTLNGSDPVIDLDGLFKGDFAGIGGWGLGSVNSSLSKWKEYKVFPQNVELTVDLALMRGNVGRRTLFHYSLSAIPESSKAYKPRVADDRIGYFMTVRLDWSKQHDVPTLFDRYINRWHLEKRDPSAELGAPKNPIVWYIEKTVPLKYRRWVKEGILEWNKAFEKCGFLDAIEVKQQEDYDRETKDLDPEDVRYNFFRWIVTGRGFAMGPSRDHPLTGQIFDADIVFDDSMVRHYVTDYARLSGGEESWQPYNPFLDDFFAAHPEWSFQRRWATLMPNVEVRRDPTETFRGNLYKYMQARGRPLCECAAGMAEQLAFAGLCLEAEGLGRSGDEFIGQIIKEIVMHEVGHCLGLRHNFKASTWLTMQEVREHKQAGDPNVGSVMDYNPPMISLRGKEQGSFTTRSIGPYDYWAIEYGYRPMGKPYKSEEELLKTVAGRVAEAGLAYATDEDTMSILSPDPLSNRFDMGSDIMTYAKHQRKLADSLLKDIDTWAVKDGQSYSRLRRAFLRIFGEKARSCFFVARFPGGQYAHRDHKGDKDARPALVPVEPETQREAVRFVCQQVFAEDAFQFSPDLLSKLAPGRQSHWNSDDYDFRQEIDIHELVAGAQYGSLMTMMNPFTIARVHDNQIKFKEDQEPYTLAEHVHGLTKAIWSELDEADRTGSDRKPFVNSFRRNLQRMHLDMLMNMVLSKPGQIVPADANALARLSVAGLSEKIAKVLKTDRVDASTLAHLTDVKKRIDKALEAQYTIGAGYGGGGFFFLREPQDQQTDPITVLPER